MIKTTLYDIKCVADGFMNDELQLTVIIADIIEDKIHDLQLNL